MAFCRAIAESSIHSDVSWSLRATLFFAGDSREHTFYGQIWSCAAAQESRFKRGWGFCVLRILPNARK